jgi:alkane 1-monooxygenase
LFFAVCIGIMSFLFLETINYLEHYGLQRQKLPSGRYERVQTHHSWNSNHFIGRIVLYELTRHSDHHFKSSKKYQDLTHKPDSPQLPFGYPTSILLALVPPLWFYIMNSRVPKVQEYNS